ncbi:hypothetical protein C8J56DRAFT_980479 [Mycena floridula]|nr:hypothetical protein C8J56DRAFT_980479 [Mycena floridula]
MSLWTTNALEPFPAIPTEILFLIIEHLVQSFPSEATRLLSLSRDTKPIVERALYSYIILNSEEETARLASIIESGCRPATFYRDQVQSICIAYMLHSFDSALRRILSVCSAIHTLAVYEFQCEEAETAYDSDTSLINMLSADTPRPSRLSFDLSFLKNRFSYPFFSLLTHLEIWNGVRAFQEFDPSSLHCLVHLTHLALMTYRAPNAQDLIQLLPRLVPSDCIQVCVLFAYDMDSEILGWTTSNQIDPRIVFSYRSAGDMAFDRSTVIIRDFPLTTYFVEQWGQRQVEGKLDMWEEAEAIIAARRVRDNPRL